MSAWDVSGAVVWSILATWTIANCLLLVQRRVALIDHNGWEFSLILAIPFSLAAVFCIARLCGAHA